MTGPRHNTLTARLVEEGASTIGFKRAVRALLADYDSDDREIPIPNRIPDAYRIDDAEDDFGQVIRVWEVECTHALPWEKLCDYADFWSALDYSCLPIDFELIAVDPSGHPFTVNLATVLYDWLFQSASEQVAS